MTLILRALGRVAFACLLSQASTLALVPTVLLADGSGLLECTCSHGDHAICSMHHRATAGSNPRCAMRSAADFNFAVIPALFGTLGLIPGATLSVSPSVTQVDLPPVTASPIAGATPPESPPPRR